LRQDWSSDQYLFKNFKGDTTASSRSSRCSNHISCPSHLKQSFSSKRMFLKSKPWYCLDTTGIILQTIIENTFSNSKGINCNMVFTHRSSLMHIQATFSAHPKFRTLTAIDRFPRFRLLFCLGVHLLKQRFIDSFSQALSIHAAQLAFFPLPL